MCMAIPALVVALIEPRQAIVDLGGVRKRVSTATLRMARVGDYVIVHAGFAVSVLDPADARQTLDLLGELAERQSGHGAALR